MQAKCAQAVAALLVRGFLALSTTDHSPVERIFGTLHSSDLAVLEVIGSLAEQLQRIEVARDDR